MAASAGEGGRVPCGRIQSQDDGLLGTQGCVVEGVPFMMYGVIDDVLFWKKRWVITVIFGV